MTNLLNLTHTARERRLERILAIADLSNNTYTGWGRRAWLSGSVRKRVARRRVLRQGVPQAAEGTL